LYKHACARLSVPQFAAAIAAAPLAALASQYACARLTAAQFDAVVNA